MIDLVELLLKKNSISFDKQELAFQIQSHPSFPSLHAITGVLNHFDIDNVAAEVPQNIETLLELPKCFIAEIETVNSKKLVTVVRKELDFFLFYSSKVKEKHTETTFLEKFTGIIVAVEKQSEEIKQVSNYKNYFLIGLLSIVTLGILLISKPTIVAIHFFFTSLIGFIISISIYKQELGVYSLIGNTFCATYNEKKDCDAVLSSKGAIVFKEYKLSDFILIYFSALTSITFFALLNNISLDILYLISLLTIPVTIYSIYYQFKIVKKWCFLCLIIVTVLWIQVSLIFFNFNFELSLISLLITAFCFLSTFLLWSFIKPNLKEFQKNKKIKIDYYKFKRNFSLFKNLLQESTRKETEIENTNEIVFGNKNSKLEILIVTNPFCGHCKPVHKMVENILHKYNNKVKIKIRFNINTANIESDVVKITSRLLEIYIDEEIDICLTAMGQIYEGESVVKWLKIWGNCYEKEKSINILKQESNWCTENGVNFTPEILINGQSFPKEYDRNDLRYFIEDLYEDSQVLRTQKII